MVLNPSVNKRQEKDIFVLGRAVGPKSLFSILQCIRGEPEITEQDSERSLGSQKMTKDELKEQN